MRLWLLWKLQPCKQIVQLLSESLDRRLKFSERGKIRLHRLVCIWCDRYIRQLKLFREILQLEKKNLEPANPAHTLSIEARSRISDALSRSDKPTSHQ